MLLTIYGTKWPILCYSPTHSLTFFYFSCFNPAIGCNIESGCFNHVCFLALQIINHSTASPVTTYTQCILSD